MKLKPVWMLCAGILFAASPVWADRIPCCEFAKDARVEITTDFGHGFERSNTAFFAKGLEESATKNALFSFSSSREDRWSADLRDLASYERFSDHTMLDKGWFDGRHRDRDPKIDNPGPTTVPESGSLPLLLLGMGTVGILARKR
jgi:hypothetical protein